MSEIVNLNRFRKAKERAEKADRAAANRAKFGRNKAEKARDAEENQKRSDLLDGAKTDQPEDDK